MTASLAGLAAALSLTACGVPPSDVIQAGEPASGMFSAAPKASAPVVVFLYFLDDGVLTAHPRTIAGPADLGTVVGALFGGPTPGETMTVTTELPRLTDAPVVTAGRGVKDVSIKLPGDAAPFSRPAMLQLACTVAHVSRSLTAPSLDADPDGSPAAPAADAQRSPARTSVHVLGDGWTMRQSADSCPEPPRP
ncbi:hypothetical protein ABZ611_21475 [Streptomyces sp. NPDC007861]|uniref:hypothetical protein n=1 Tax=Streptomyces sp. NPDC007861 TaxID=3154893 RepID=UPI0033C6BC25